MCRCWLLLPPPTTLPPTTPPPAPPLSCSSNILLLLGALLLLLFLILPALLGILGPLPCAEACPCPALASGRPPDRPWLPRLCPRSPHLTLDREEAFALPTSLLFGTPLPSLAETRPLVLLKIWPVDTTLMRESSVTVSSFFSGPGAKFSLRVMPFLWMLVPSPGPCLVRPSLADNSG